MSDRTSADNGDQVHTRGAADTGHLSGEAPVSGRDGPVLDPARHLLGMLSYATGSAMPITLDQEAAAIRRQLATEVALNAQHATEPRRPVRLTELQGMIVGGLLQELAARLAPGAVGGPGHGSVELSRVVAELAELVLSQTFVGRQ